MRIGDVISMCLKNLYKRKLRTFLTLLGVMIGTGSIILMISLGYATNAQFDQMADDMNISMTEIQVQPMWGGWMGTPDGGIIEMTQQDLTEESIASFLRIPGVQTATPMMSAELMFRSGAYTSVLQVVGIRPDALAHMGYDMESGRLLTSDDDAFTFVFSTRTERTFFDATDRTVMPWMAPRLMDTEDTTVLIDIFNDPIRLYYDTSTFWNTRDWGWGGGWDMPADDDFGEEFEDMAPPRSFDVNVVGVIAVPPLEWRWGGGTTIYTDIETLQAITLIQYEAQRRQREEDEWNPTFSATVEGPEETFSDVRVRTFTADGTAEIAEIIGEMGYWVQYPGEWIEYMRESQRGVETLLMMIAAVSLFVAAINIANTMITSVTERTREIGVMKVIGASLADIRKLFLLEAATIGFLGGLLGVIIALGFSYAMNNFDIPFLANLGMGVPEWAAGEQRAAISLVTPWLCIRALGIAVIVGIVSGFFPALRATQLSALAAIRGD